MEIALIILRACNLRVIHFRKYYAPFDGVLIVIILIDFAFA